MAKLLLYLSELWKEVTVIGAIHKIGPKEQTAIDSLAEMAKAISAHKNLEELVIFVHGFTGGMMLGDDAYSLDEEPVAKAFAKKTTKVEHIRFEGCWVGEAPNKMATFGRLFDAKTVSGFTWVHWLNQITINLPHGTTTKSLETVLKSVSGTTSSLLPWIPPPPGGPALAQLASMASTGNAQATVPLEWFQYGLEEHQPFMDNNIQHLGKHTYKVRTDATQKTVQAKDAQPYTQPIPPFDYVTVVLTEAAQKPNKAQVKQK
jgi:hypothetical protein